MKINTIITDMDGTLLRKKGDQIQSFNREVLEKWQAEGNNLFLATGWLDLAILPFIHQLKITKPVISCNGGLIREFTTGEILYKSNIALAKIQQILTIIKPFAADYHIYTTKRIIGPANTGKIAFFHEQNKLLPENEQVPYTITDSPLDIMDKDEYPLKVLVVEADQAKKAAIKEALAACEMSVLSSGSNLIDIMNNGIDKAHGLQFLADQGYLDLTETAAFGDNENDIAMLELAAVGVAMANSIPLTLERADRIAGHHNSGGLGKFVQSEFY